MDFDLQILDFELEILDFVGLRALRLLGHILPRIRTDRCQVQ